MRKLIILLSVVVGFAITAVPAQALYTQIYGNWTYLNNGQNVQGLGKDCNGFVPSVTGGGFFLGAFGMWIGASQPVANNNIGGWRINVQNNSGLNNQLVVVYVICA